MLLDVREELNQVEYSEKQSTNWAALGLGWFQKGNTIYLLGSEICSLITFLISLVLFPAAGSSLKGKSSDMNKNTSSYR